MVRLISILCFVAIVNFGHAQQSQYSNDNRPLKLNLGLSQTFMSHHPDKNLYLDGNLEYYTQKNLSLKGNYLWFIDSRLSNPIYKQNVIVLFGSGYHFSKSSHDLSIGIQPGFTYSTPNYYGIEDYTYSGRMMPALSISTTYTLFFAKYCHFFLNAQYLISRYRGTASGSLLLDEFMISGGLGFQIYTKKVSK